MATLTFHGGATITDAERINNELEPLNVQLAKWPVEREHPTIKALLEKPALEPAEKEELLVAFDPYFHALQDAAGYKTRDMVVLHPDLPGLEDALAKFTAAHTHDDDEVRYIIDGEGVFGFIFPSGKQAELKVESEDYINVPKGTEHWFRLTDKRRIKAIRYFTSMDGWSPNYTGTNLMFK